MFSLNTIIPLRNAILRTRIFIWNRFWGMSIDPTAKVSISAKLDFTNPKGMHIGARSYVTFGATILCHDLVRRMHVDTHILENCFIGCRSIIMPGVRVGPNAIVASGAVVTEDVEPFTIVAGNPARVLRRDAPIGPYGLLQDRKVQQE